MAKDRKDAPRRAGVEGDARKRARRVRRLARQLDDVREQEARRSRRATEARDRGAGSRLLARRERKLEKVRRRRASIEAELEGLLATPASAADGVAATPGETVADDPAPEPAVPAAPPAAVGAVRGYCLRDRQAVAIADPRPVVMRNGRAGIEGTCPACGARLVRPGRL